MKFKKNFLPIFILICALAAGCQRGRGSTADVPYLISPNYNVSVAPFTQPFNAGQLISGMLPEYQGRISEDELQSLDLDLREVLRSSTRRQYNFIIGSRLPDNYYKTRSAVQPGGLGDWLQYGKKHEAQLLLVPQVLDWHERQGSQAGVTDSAHVRVEFFLLNIAEGQVMGRSVFEEKQTGLADNLLSFGDFLKRKGQWVSARELTVDGMRKAIKELGL